MTKKQILEFEHANQGNVIRLHKEGTFYKAYEISAFLLVNFVNRFKVSCHYFKVVDDYIASVGFPIGSLSKWCGGYKMNCGEDFNDVFLEISADDIKTRFTEWKARLVESSKKSYESSFQYLPVYGLAYRTAIELTQMCSNMKRAYRYSLGEDLRKAAMEMLLDIKLAASSVDKRNLVHISRIELMRVNMSLRMLADLKELKDSRYVYFMEMLDSISGQLALWEKSLLGESPAGMPMQ